MARVPVQEGQQVLPQAAPMPLASGDVPTGALGTGLAAGLTQVARVAARWAEEEKQKADATATLMGETDWSRRANDDLFHVPTADDPRQGFFNLEGSNAIGKGAETMQRILAAHEAVLRGLGNDDQRRAFLMRTADRIETIRTQVATHENQQIAKVHDDAYDARLAEGLRTISLNYTDPRAVDGELAKLDGAAKVKAQQLGVTPETIIAKNRSDARRLVLNQLLADRNGAAARQYFRDHGQEIDPQVRANYAHDVAVVGLATEAEVKTLELLGKAKGDPQAALDRLDADVQPGDLKDATRERLKARASEARERDELAVSLAFNRAYTAYDASRGGNGVGSLAAIAPLDLAYLTRHRAGLIQNLRDIQDRDQRIARGEEAYADPIEEARATVEILQAARTDPVGFASPTNDLVQKYAHRMSKQALGWAIKAQDQVAEQNQKGSKNWSLFTPKEMVLRSAQRLELVPPPSKPQGKWKDRDYETLWQLQDFVDTRWQGFVDAKHQEPTDKDVDAWIQEANRQILVKGKYFGWNAQRMFQRPTDRAYRIPLTYAETQQADAALRSAGLEPTDDLRQEWWKRKLATPPAAPVPSAPGGGGSDLGVPPPEAPPGPDLETQDFPWGMP